MTFLFLLLRSPSLTLFAGPVPRVVYTTGSVHAQPKLLNRLTAPSNGLELAESDLLQPRHAAELGLTQASKVKISGIGHL